MAWLSNPSRDLLSGLVVGLALIPEALAFSLIAHVAPSVTLYTAGILAITTAFVGWDSGKPRAWRTRLLWQSGTLVVVVGLVVATSNLAIGVVAGVALSAIFGGRAALGGPADPAHAGHPDTHDHIADWQEITPG